MGINREMGKNNLEGTSEKAESIREAGDTRVNEAQEIDGQLKQIEGQIEGLDSEDIQAFNETTADYGDSFSEAIQNEVTEPTNEIGQRGREDISGLNENKEKAEGIKSTYENIAGVSDVGSDIGNAAASQMEQSANEYGNIIDEYNGLLEEAENDAKNKEGIIEGLF